MGTCSYLRNLGLSVLAAASLSACATLMDGSQQHVKFEVRGTDKARCVLENEDYKYLIYAPITQYLERSRKDLHAECTGDNGKLITFIIPSLPNTPNVVLYNTVTGLAPGAATDIVSGAAFKFPDTVIIDFDVHDGYIANELTEKDVIGRGVDINQIWPLPVEIKEPEDEPQETPSFIPIEDEAEKNAAFIPQTMPQDDALQEKSSVEMLHQHYNPSRTAPLPPMGYSKQRMQPIISPEDMQSGAARPPAVDTTPNTNYNSVAPDAGGSDDHSSLNPAHLHKASMGGEAEMPAPAAKLAQGDNIKRETSRLPLDYEPQAPVKPKAPEKPKPALVTTDQMMQAIAKQSEESKSGQVLREEDIWKNFADGQAEIPPVELPELEPAAGGVVIERIRPE